MVHIFYGNWNMCGECCAIGEEIGLDAYLNEFDTWFSYYTSEPCSR